ncbi:hypothetical protein BGZ49_001437 [Haplosporangium sp. Z 27]|nr:hypothetical protein BGZ49_001437 [Haplosporangium sp. Z 27]
MPPLPFWKRPDHRIPTLGLYRALLKTTLELPVSCVNQPGKYRVPIPIKGVGPPGSSDPLPSIKRSYLFAHIRDCFRSNRYCTSPRITTRYLLEAEEALKKLEKARDGDQVIRKELEDLVNGRTGRLKEVLDHLKELINFEPGKTTQRSRYDRLKRAHEQVWDIRTQSSIARDPSSFYRITLKPSLFTFPPDLDYYPPTKYPNQMKNQRGKYKNFGGVFLTEVTTSEGSKFPRIRGGTQPEWLSMMLKSRVKRSVKRVNEWKELEETKAMMELEEKFSKNLGVEDSGYVELIDQRLKNLKDKHVRKKFETNSTAEPDL